MSLNRRSFLRALVGVPFAAKAIEAIIARGAPAPQPIALTPEPKWKKPAPGPQPVYGFSGAPVPSGYHGIVRVYEDGLAPIQVGDLVRVNDVGRIEYGTDDDRFVVGYVVGYVVGSTVNCSSVGPIETVVDIQLTGGIPVSSTVLRAVTGQQ